MGLITAHVDDFLVCGNESSPEWAEAVHGFYARFRWSPWEHSRFLHCGVDMECSEEGVKMHHDKYCEGLQQIDVPASMSDEEPATPSQVTELRALLGGAQWRAYKTAPQHQAKVGLLLSQVGKATGRVLREANKLCREMHQGRFRSVNVNFLPNVALADVQFVCWTDAAVANRHDLSSTGGYVIAATGPAMTAGMASELTLVSWRSAKLPRVCRSSLSAEVQAFSEGEEELMYTRLAWAELRGLAVDLQNVTETLRLVGGVMVTDAKSLYDIIRKDDLNTAALGMKDKYSALEVMSVLERLRRGATTTRWVNSDAQLADAMTKWKADSSLHQVIASGVWTLTYDENFVAAKKKKTKQQANAFVKAQRRFLGRVNRSHRVAGLSSPKRPISCV